MSTPALPAPPALTHTSSAIPSTPIDLYSSTKYFYIVLTATPHYSPSAAPNPPPFVLTLHDPAPPTSFQSRDPLTRTIGGLTNATLNTAGALANVVTNTVAGVTGLDNRLRVGKMRLRLQRRSGRLQEKWMIGEDGLIYSAWKRDYVLGGKPAKFYEILTTPAEPPPGGSNARAESMGSVLGVGGGSGGPPLNLGAYGEAPSDAKEKLGRAITARDLQLNRGGLKGITGLICRLPSHSASQSNLNASDSSLHAMSSPDVLRTANGAMGFGVPKQLGVLRQCCGVEECEKERLGEGAECGFIAVNGEEERDDRVITTLPTTSTLPLAPSAEEKESTAGSTRDLRAPAAGERKDDAAKKKPHGFFHLPGLSSKKKKEKKEAEEAQRSALLAERARVEAERQARERREKEAMAALTPGKGTFSAAADPVAFTPPTSSSSGGAVTNASAASKRDSFLDLHKWRVEGEFVAFLYDHVYGVLWDFMGHLSYKQYQKQIRLLQEKEKERSSSAVRTPIKTSVDWEWSPILSVESKLGECSVWRPAVPPGHCFFGDWVHSKRSQPIERVTVAQSHIAFAKPKLYQKVWERTHGGGSPIYVWSPLPPSEEYHALGHICTSSPTSPNPDTIPLVCVHRSYLKFNALSLRQQVWAVDAGQGGDHEGSFWRTPAPLSTLLVSTSASDPPTGAFYTLLEAYEPSEPSPLSIPVTSISGPGGPSDWSLVWDDRNTLTNRSCSFWRPRIKDGTVRFGDMAILGHDPPSKGSMTALDHPGFRRPLTYELEYKVHRSTKRCWIWRPIPADSEYRVLGFVATATADPPSLDCMRCVHKRLLVPYGNVEQAWLESNSDVQNMTVLAAGRYMVGVGGDDKWGEAMVWRNTSTSTFFSYKNTHRGPALPHYRLPISAVEHTQVVARLESTGLEMVEQCLGLLETVQQTIKDSNFVKLGLTPRQIAVLLQAVQGCQRHVDSEVPEERLEVSAEFLQRLQPMRVQLTSIYSTLKRFVYDKVAGSVSEFEDTIALLDTLYPILTLLPDIDASDNPSAWTFKPRISARQHKSVLAALFDEQVGNMLAEKFFTAFPPDVHAPDIDSPVGRGVGADGKSKVSGLLEVMEELLEDLKTVELNTDEPDIRVHYIEIYHSHFRSLLASQFKPQNMVISELLSAVKFLYKYTTLVEQLCGHGEVTVRMCSDFDSLIDACMDEHDDQQKTRIIGWVGNIIRNEEKNSADKDDDGFYQTSGSQDLFLNINSLYDHAVQQDLGAKALFRVAIMYAHVLLYYQECLKRFLAQLEVAEEVGGGSAGVGAAAAGVDAGLLSKPMSFLLAQINNYKAYEADTEDLHLHVTDSLHHELADEQLEDIDEIFDDVGDGFFDVATAAVQVLIKRVLKPLLPYLSGLFTASHVQGAGYLQTNVLDPLNDSYEMVAKGINRDAFINSFIQDSCASILNVYVRALLTNLHKSGEKLSAIFNVVQSDRRALVTFYTQWADYQPEDVLQRRLGLISAFQLIASAKGDQLQKGVETLSTLLVNDPVLTPYVALQVLLDMRSDLDAREKVEVLSHFPEERERKDRLKKLNLSDLSLTGASVAYQLEVTVVRGDRLAPKDTDTSDPYVILSVLETPTAPKPLTVRRTPWLKKTLSPEWQVRWVDFSAKDVASFKCLLFEVWDHDVLGSDFMGRAVVTLEQIRQQRLLSVNLNNLNAQPTGAAASSKASATQAAAAAVSKVSERELHDREPLTFVLPLTTREGVRNEGDDFVSGTLTVQIAYYSKPIPTVPPPSALPAALAGLQAPEKPKPPPAATASVLQYSDLTTGHIMAGLDRGPDTSKFDFSRNLPGPVPVVSTTSSPAVDATGGVLTDDSHRTLLDRVMFRHRKALVPKADAEDPEVQRQRERERQRKEAEAETRRAHEADEMRSAEITRLTARAGQASVSRKLTGKGGRTWWGGSRSTKAMMRKQRLDETKEREQRYLELQKKQKEEEWIAKGALGQAMVNARGQVLGGSKKSNDCTIM